MQGFITEADLGQADAVFPGIERFFDSLAEKPRTFLELLSEFERWAYSGSATPRDSSARSRIAPTGTSRTTA